MVQWLAHMTCNPGNAGSIPTHGICVFHSKWISQYFVLAGDHIVGFPVLHSKYIYICVCVCVCKRCWFAKDDALEKRIQWIQNSSSLNNHK